MNPVSKRPYFAGPSADHRATPPHVNHVRLAMAACWVVVIMVLCWIPGNMVHNIEDGSRLLQVPNLDKAVHGAIFAVFAVLWARLGTSRHRFAWIALGGFVLAVTTEVVQNLLIIGRDGSIADTTVDLVGVLIGIAVAPRVEPWARRLESRLFSRSKSTPVPVPGTTMGVGEGARAST